MTHHRTPSVCPYLPTPRSGIDWRHLHVHRTAVRGPAFYFDCLEYGNALWLQGCAGRAILCIDRAFSADLKGNEPVLANWPLPYAAMVWILKHAPKGGFAGNPRVHFQHYADRVRPPRRDQRRWRAWACWALTRAILPDLPGDPKHAVDEPSPAEIGQNLSTHGIPGEAEHWARELSAAALR